MSNISYRLILFVAINRYVDAEPRMMLFLLPSVVPGEGRYTGLDTVTVQHVQHYNN